MQVPRTAARLAHFAVAVMALAVAGRIWLSIFVPGSVYAVEGEPSIGMGALRWASYAQVQAALFVMISSGMLSMIPVYKARWFRVLRLAGVSGLLVTGFGHFIVSQAADRSANVLIDVIVPLLTVMVWIVYGPRWRISWKTIAYVVAWPPLTTALLLVLGVAAGLFWDPLVARAHRTPAPLLLTGLTLTVGVGVFATVLHAVDRIVAHHPSPTGSDPE